MYQVLKDSQSIAIIERPRVAAFGEWNTANLGDRAIFEGVQAYFQEAGWDVDAYGLGTLTPVSLHASNTQQGNESSLSLLNRAMHDPTSYKRKRFSSEFFQPMKQTVRGLRQQYRMKSLLPQLQTADAILVGGGSLLSDFNLHFPQSLVAIAQAAKLLGVPLLSLGCGAVENWSPEGKTMITEFAEACTFIGARDQATANRLSEIVSTPIPIFGDFALSLPNTYRKSRSRDQHVLAINVMHLSDQRQGYQEQYESVLIELINRWLQKYDGHQDAIIKIFTTGTYEDILPARRVAAKITSDQVQLHIPRSVTWLNEVLRNCDVVLASRLHAAILAISNGTSVMALGAGHTSRKLNNFFQSIGLSGYSFSALDEGAAAKGLSILDGQLLQKQYCHLNLQQVTKTRAEVNTVLNSLIPLTC